MTKEQVQAELRAQVDRLSEMTGMSKTEVLEMMKEQLTLNQKMATKPRPAAELGTSQGTKKAPGLPPNQSLK